MDRTGLEYFVALAEELHFARAAERCHISQPAMSQQIRRLEQAIGVRLAHRNKRMVSLTPAGIAFLGEARKMLRQMSEAADMAVRVDRGEIGQLRLGVTAPALYVVYPEIAALFRTAHPDIGVLVQEMTTAEQERALQVGDLDIGLIHPPLEGGGLAVQEIGRAPFHVALPSDHRLTAAKSLELGDLADEQAVIFPRQIAPQLYDTVLRQCQEAGFTLKIAMEAFPAQSIIALVAAGVGIGFIASRTQRLDRHGVTYRPIRGPHPQLSIGVAYHTDGTTPAVLAFLAAARTAGRAMR
ncbi:LysR family transcriptional regulator [Mycobacterium sp. 21AC1]|uniref:LysR family transcriptional regulator n=1 Tax=[Mycobacterium] appelbergii TaxID=2939269 RepID=UPI002938E7B1|nr:LysR family transcriptional regulator [Mycobacterium sp. 21AC1]MDV3127539.1 LysR family transcriptional regulator [Mycobacterium sp. 21AC1]